MSCADRNFADLGTKLLAIQPLGLQVVDLQDSRIDHDVVPHDVFA
jgi:hypothetical protein